MLSIQLVSAEKYQNNIFISFGNSQQLRYLSHMNTRLFPFLAQLDEAIVAQTATLSLPLVDPTPAVVVGSTSTSNFGLTSLVVTAVISVLSSSAIAVALVLFMRNQDK